MLQQPKDDDYSYAIPFLGCSLCVDFKLFYARKLVRDYRDCAMTEKERKKD